MGYDIAAKTEAESVIPEEFGGMWFLKESLEANTIGLTVLELEPGGTGKEHDESESGQEEIYYVVEGSVEVSVGAKTVALGPDEAIRLDPSETRKIHNTGDERARLVLVGAPL